MQLYPTLLTVYRFIDTNMSIKKKQKQNFNM